jgi:hypothetical protein
MIQDCEADRAASFQGSCVSCNNKDIIEEVVVRVNDQVDGEERSSHTLEEHCSQAQLEDTSVVRGHRTKVVNRKKNKTKSVK